MANFETFSRQLLSLKSEPAVTIQKRGAMSINKSAFAILGSPDAVELLYDRRARTIGLRAVRATADHAYPVRRSTRSASGPWVVSAMAFTRFYDIDTSKTRRWPARLADGILCIDLNLEPAIVQTNRAPRAPQH